MGTAEASVTFPQGIRSRPSAATGWIFGGGAGKRDSHEQSSSSPSRCCRDAEARGTGDHVLANLTCQQVAMPCASSQCEECLRHPGLGYMGTASHDIISCKYARGSRVRKGNRSVTSAFVGINHTKTSGAPWRHVAVGPTARSRNHHNCYPARENQGKLRFLYYFSGKGTIQG